MPEDAVEVAMYAAAVGVPVAVNPVVLFHAVSIPGELPKYFANSKTTTSIAQLKTMLASPSRSVPILKTSHAMMAIGNYTEAAACYRRLDP